MQLIFRLGVLVRLYLMVELSITLVEYLHHLVLNVCVS